jgi:hypothetical protein
MATRPANACGWIPTADVVRIIGPLAGEPTPRDRGCFYPIPIDSASAARLARTKELERRLAAITASAAPELKKDMQSGERGVFVLVDLSGDVTGDKVMAAVGAKFAAMLSEGKQNTAAPKERPKPPDGWDDAHGPLGEAGFEGRLGHVRVSVSEEIMKSQLSREKARALALAVRDRIPDRPFAFSAGVKLVSSPGGPDPCSLLTRAEAEEVLGKLVVAPYRSTDDGPLVDGDGKSCAYYTAGHHVFVLSPEWTGGKESLRMTRGIGSLTGLVVKDPDAETADTLEGPWDDAVTSMDGRLSLLEGDRLLTVSYLTSSTDAAGAAVLARKALQRLAESRP